MDFGEALKALKEGKKVARRGWNGRNMYIYLTRGHKVSSKDWSAKDQVHEMTDHERLSGGVTVLPHIDMYSAHGERVIGWLASQTDMLSDDWEIIE